MLDTIRKMGVPIIYNGTLAITEVFHEKVVFLAINVAIEEGGVEALMNLTQSKFGEDCKCEAVDGPSAGYNFTFTRFIDRPLHDLEDIQDFLVSTQEMLNEMLEKLYEQERLWHFLNDDE